MDYDLPEFIEETNEHGFPQTMQHDGQGKYFPVCSDCRACVMPNRGQGMICDACDHEFTLHCEADLF
jgi:hypothetical protein